MVHRGKHRSSDSYAGQEPAAQDAFNKTGKFCEIHATYLNIYFMLRLLSTGAISMNRSSNGRSGKVTEHVSVIAITYLIINRPVRVA